MPNIRNDGAVIPSYLGVQARGKNRSLDTWLNDDRLRLGEVIDIVYPDDDRSYTKLTREYVLRAQYRNGDGVMSTNEYRGVAMSSIFGSAADYFSAALRKDDSKDKDKTEFGTGARVVFMCVGGDQRRALILGGIENYDEDQHPKPSKDSDPKLYWEFNGFRLIIDKDGEAHIEMKGATKNNGELTDEADTKAKGTQLYFQKDGSLDIITGDGNEDNPRFNLDLPNKKITITTKGEFKVDVKGDITMLGNKKGLIDVEDEMRISSGKRVILSNTKGVHCGDANENWVKGKTYRNKESQMNSSLKDALNSAAQACSEAMINMNAASSANATPYTGGAAAQSSFSQVGSALGNIGKALTQMADAIGRFEYNADDYLSKLNFGD